MPIYQLRQQKYGINLTFCMGVIIAKVNSQQEVMPYGIQDTEIK